MNLLRQRTLFSHSKFVINNFLLSCHPMDLHCLHISNMDFGYATATYCNPYSYFSLNIICCQVQLQLGIQKGFWIAYIPASNLNPSGVQYTHLCPTSFFDFGFIPISSTLLLASSVDNLKILLLKKAIKVTVEPFSQLQLDI